MKLMSMFKLCQEWAFLTMKVCAIALAFIGGMADFYYGKSLQMVRLLSILKSLL